MEIDQLGPYKILRPLGHGGMGTVYQAINIDTRQPAAIKLLSVHLVHHEGFRDRFAAEIEALLKLNHPNIVRLFGFGEQADLLFYAMELVEGNSLEYELSHGRRFDWREVTQIGVEVCQALKHAHDRGVIHRDLKPGNLLLAKDGHVKLSDFGIARLFGNTRLTQAGNVLGTAEYMAPEQAQGRPVDPRTDLYSLGAVLYVLLTRRPLFSGKSLGEILDKQRFEPPERVRLYAPDTPSMLDDIIAQLLEKNPEQRVPNATLLARQLKAMQRALSLGSPEVNDLAVTIDDGAGHEPAHRDIAPPPVLPSESPPDKPPPTRAADSNELAAAVTAPFLPKPPTVPAGDMPPTILTKAPFSSGTRPAETRKPAAHFTPVTPEDLDRPEPIESHRRTPWISAQIWVLAAALIVLAATVWYFLQPPSAERLYRRIADRTQSGSISSLLESEDDIREFLMRFPEDPRAHELRDDEEEIELYHLEQKFKRRVQGFAKGEVLLPIEQTYLEALNYVWLDPDLGMAKLQAIVDLYDTGNVESGPTGRCLELARRRLARLSEQLDGQTSHRLALVHDRLNRADELRQSDPQQARAVYQAVIELYADKPWAQASIQRARQALQTLEKPQPAPAKH